MKAEYFDASAYVIQRGTLERMPREVRGQEVCLNALRSLATKRMLKELLGSWVPSKHREFCRLQMQLEGRL